jgi:hypothetical protein
MMENTPEVTEKEYLEIIQKVLNNNGWFFYRDIKKMWSDRFTEREMEILKRVTR